MNDWLTVYSTQVNALYRRKRWKRIACSVFRLIVVVLIAAAIMQVG